VKSGGSRYTVAAGASGNVPTDSQPSESHRSLCVIASVVAVHKLRNLERKAPKHALDELREDFHRIVYAAYGAVELKWPSGVPASRAVCRKAARNS